MQPKKDHTVLIVVCLLIGVVLTATVAIIGSVYNNDKNVARDQYFADHCSQVTKNIDNSTDPAKIKYLCN